MTARPIPGDLKKFMQKSTVKHSDMSNEQNAENVMLVNEHFGTLWRCMISLFCAITGGNDWMMYAGPLRLFGQGELWFLMFVFYVLVCSVGVLNVVTGIFVDSAVCTRTEDEVVQNWKEDQQRTSLEVKRIFYLADKDESGSMSFSELCRQLQNPWVRAYFSGLDIDPNEAKIIFTLMDTDNDGVVSIDEFIDGTMKMKGHAKSVDVMAMMFDQAAFSMKFNKLCSYIEDELRGIKDTLTPNSMPTPRIFATLEDTIQHQLQKHGSTKQSLLDLRDHWDIDEAEPVDIIRDEEEGEKKAVLNELMGLVPGMSGRISK